MEAGRVELEAASGPLGRPHCGGKAAVTGAMPR
jgi:hypothetical protein